MKKTYKYVIELDKAVWPHHIVDELIGRFGKVRDAKLISVKDLQYKKCFMVIHIKLAFPISEFGLCSCGFLVYLP